MNNLFLALTTCGCDFASAHQVANVLLQELVVVIKLVVLFANGFDTVEDGKKGVLQGFGMSSHLFPSSLSNSIEILARSPGAHCPDVIRAKVRLEGTNC
jgi:hypothetical protein